jgi:hypothetical protein
MWGILAIEGGRNADAVTIDCRSDADGRRKLRDITSPSTELPKPMDGAKSDLQG